MGIFSFSTLRSALTSVQDRLVDLDQQIAKLTEKRTRLVGEVLPYEDFRAWVAERFDHKASDYPRQVQDGLLSSVYGSALMPFFMAPRDNHHTLDDFLAVFQSGKGCCIPFERPLVGMGSTPTDLADSFLYFVLRDAMKISVCRMLDEVLKPKWPSEVGLPRAERVKVLEKLESQLTELIAERDGIRRELAGVLPS